MSKIDDLVKRLCPNGVKYKTIKDITKVLRGKRLTTKELNDDESFPVYHGGLEPLGYYHDFNRVGDTVMVINVGASAGTVGYSKCDFWSSDGCYCIEHSDMLLNRYLYHYLKNNELYFIGRVRKAGIPTLDSSVIERFKVAIPPIKVQEEIVKILDKFGELEAELEAELEERKSQYEFWYKKLLNEKNDDKTICLGEIGKVCMCKRIMKNETNITGDIPFYKIGTFGKEPNAYISKELFENYRTRFSYPKKGDVLISCSGTIGRAVIFDGHDSYYQDSNIVWIDNDESKILNKFLYYIYQMSPWKIEEGGTIKRLYTSNIVKTKIPYYSIEKQKKIVEILDKFDKLVNDISEGIPAEIEARKKQYEYYRNKLLTFEEVSCE